MNAALPNAGSVALQPGQVMDDFIIEEKLGEGGMADLYLAHDTHGERRVIKMPHCSFGVDPVSLVAFENELRLATYLKDFPYAHMPHARGPADAPYLVMDYISGMDLWGFLKERGVLTEPKAIALIKRVVHAVRELHKRRILHLDLKLSNVMLTGKGEVRLIDFGLANHLDQPDLIYESFREPKGTPAYIAPEQFIGMRDEPRSDMFSIGAMLFELTTGKLPYPEANTALELIGRIRAEVVSPRRYQPKLSQKFEDVVHTCLRHNPDDRFPSLDHLAEMLESWHDEIQTLSPALVPDPSASACDVRARSLLARAICWIQHCLRRHLMARTDHFHSVWQWVKSRRDTNMQRPYRILVALDPSSGEELNLDILRQAYHLAALQPSAITVLTALTVDVGMASGDKEAQFVNEQLGRARKAIAKLLQRAGPAQVPVGINSVIGQPLGAIQQCVEDYGVDLVVIGCKPRSALAKFIHGNTGYKVLTSIKRSIHVVYPRAA